MIFPTVPFKDSPTAFGKLQPVGNPLPLILSGFSSSVPMKSALFRRHDKQLSGALERVLPTSSLFYGISVIRFRFDVGQLAPVEVFCFHSNRPASYVNCVYSFNKKEKQMLVCSNYTL